MHKSMRLYDVVLIISLLISSSFAADINDRQPASHPSDAVNLKSGDDNKPSLMDSNGSSKGDVEGGEGGGGSRQSNYFNIFENLGIGDSDVRRRCPLCDNSVYPYCGDKLFHDACCCTDPFQHPLPHKCRYADCAFLHANSCREHRLISNCCCSDEYRSLIRGSGKQADQSNEKGKGQ